jgi:NAD-dependent dihydropyrimidine dehydrogenase PreA subunit
MPTYVNPNKCDGCKALDKPACQYICPSDIMQLDAGSGREMGKAFNAEPDMCWECCWEVWDRFWCASTHILLYRRETRWPGYYYRADFPKIDEANWRCFVNSTYDAAANAWTMRTQAYLQIID